jgi:hypothetical protein
LFGLLSFDCEVALVYDEHLFEWDGFYYLEASIEYRIEELGLTDSSGQRRKILMVFIFNVKFSIDNGNWQTLFLFLVLATYLGFAFSILDKIKCYFAIENFQNDLPNNFILFLTQTFFLNTYIPSLYKVTYLSH